MEAFFEFFFREAKKIAKMKFLLLEKHKTAKKNIVLQAFFLEKQGYFEKATQFF